MILQTSSICKQCCCKLFQFTKFAIPRISLRRSFAISSLRSQGKGLGKDHMEGNKSLSCKKAMSEFIYTNNTHIALLQCEDAFNELTDKEKKYAHYLSRGSWYGGLIDLFQVSVESPLIYNLLTKLFRHQSVSELKEVAFSQCSFTEDDFQAVLIYTCGVLYNMGNYKSFGDSKFIPNVDKDKLKKLVLSSKFAAVSPKEVDQLLSRCLEKMYSLSDNELGLGFPEQATTTYLSKNITKEDNEIVNEFLKKHNISVWNSRLFKTVDEAGTVCFEIRLASILDTESPIEGDLIKEVTEDGRKFVITRGDYSSLLTYVHEHLLLAKKYAANEIEEKALESFARSFKTGSVDAHKDGSRFWVKDKGPMVESYIGFIETYKDPAGIRGEFESFVAMVNKKLSAKFEDLVASAENLVSLLPWPSSYEKDKFLQPDFTSLDVLTFAGSTPPSGICIPNYDEIRQKDGFKNVYLGNVIQSTSLEPPNYLKKEDQDMVLKYRIRSYAITVGLHELLGHGSGKLFSKNKDGSYNFDIQTVRNCETNKEITSWYNEGETYSNVFGDLSNSYEECRAECVALYLSDVPEVLRIFSAGTEGETIVYTLWLLLLHSGVEGLQMYDPKTKTWLQAHCRARYVILQVLLEAGEDFVKVERVEGADGDPDLLLSVDCTKVATVGKLAIENFLRKLQLYKATADVASGKKMFDKYSEVSSEGKHPFLNFREIIMARKKPRKMFVQANTFLEDGNVKLKNYEATPEGLIQSWIERFQLNEVENHLEELWAKDQHHFQ